MARRELIEFLKSEIAEYAGVQGCEEYVANLRTCLDKLTKKQEAA